MKKFPFKVSTALKDLVGRDLIANDLVAVFELVKNSFDAHATAVQLQFENDKIVIIDNGKGMSQADIINKWLFLGYSAKRDGTEDEGYRDQITSRKRKYAGAKGVGRFSCDRLGERLLLCSCAEKKPVQILEIDWTRYEKDPKQEFSKIEFNLNEEKDFPDSIWLNSLSDRGTGTVLEIKGLRSKWDREKLQNLKRELSKLINPFAVDGTGFKIMVIAKAEEDADEKDKNKNKNRLRLKTIVNGEVKNEILDVLKMKTTSINIAIKEEGKVIETILQDRGELIYQIKEANPYDKLISINLNVKIYYLNRSARSTFTRRMGLSSAEFGSIFLYRNGFRIFPIGQENDDFFDLARRKQQGNRRYLGTRDIMGRVEINCNSNEFKEATSREGLIYTPEVKELIDCVISKCIRRLEKYVVDIIWKDSLDNKVSDLSRMMQDENSALIGELVSKLSAAKGVQLIDYNPDLVRIVDEKSTGIETSLIAMKLLAEKTGNKFLLKRVAFVSAKLKKLEASEDEARKLERQAEKRATVAEGKFEEERKHNLFLMAAASLDQDTILNLHHQILMYASDANNGLMRIMRKLRKNTTIHKEEWFDILGNISFRLSQIMTAARFATKSQYKHQSTEAEADLTVYIHDYITTISALWAPQGITVDVKSDGIKSSMRRFRPIEVGIVIDNLVSNAAKAHATRISFILEVSLSPKQELSVVVADDGTGWPQSFNPVARVFEKGVTTTEGSGLGLYHVKQVIERLGGIIEVKHEPYSQKLNGAQLKFRIPI